MKQFWLCGEQTQKVYIFYILNSKNNKADKKWLLIEHVYNHRLETTELDVFKRGLWSSPVGQNDDLQELDRRFVFTLKFWLSLGNSSNNII